jgi:hypothetical protein
MLYRSSICAVAALAAALLATPSVAQVVDFGKYPDLKGQWVRTGNPNNWRELAGPAPLTPEYQKIFEDITADLKAGGPGNWPSTFCTPAGMPAMMSFYDPAEIIVMPDITYILISHNDDSYRRIYTDGRDWPAEIIPSFAGYSIGQWRDEGHSGRYDVLEIETRGLKGPRAFDSTGLPLHKDNQTIVKERIYQDKADPSVLYDEITTIDHALTRPWTATKNYRRSKDPQPVWQEFVCAESNPWLIVGKDTYYLSGDGYLMPTRKGQSPPDTRYFNQAPK